MFDLYTFSNIFFIIQEKGGNVELKNNENLTPINCAINECHFELLEIFKNFVFENKFKTKKINYLTLPGNNQIVSKYTPNRINYNFDVTSPYYVNITHRKKCRTPEPSQSPKSPTPKTPEQLISSDDSDSDTDVIQENLFALTAHNIQELNINKSVGRKSLVDKWREKVEISSQHRESFFHHSMADVRRMLDTFCEEDELSFCNKMSSTKNSDTMFTCNPDSSFHTAISTRTLVNADLTNLPHINALYHMAEEYVHTDAENGVQFFERKVCAQPMSP